MAVCECMVRSVCVDHVCMYVARMGPGDTGTVCVAYVSVWVACIVLCERSCVGP